MVDILDFIPYYPTLEDDKFNSKIYSKKEFNQLNFFSRRAPKRF